jgi:hypothetical protein
MKPTSTYVGNGAICIVQWTKRAKLLIFFLTEQRDEQAATCFLIKAIRRHGVPETITIDGSEANAAAIRGYNAEHGTAIVIRQGKYLNNILEQDHRAVKRITRPMQGFKSFDAAQYTLTGNELMHMLRKAQLAEGDEQGLRHGQQFYALIRWGIASRPCRAADNSKGSLRVAGTTLIRPTAENGLRQASVALVFQ